MHRFADCSMGTVSNRPYSGGDNIPVSFQTIFMEAKFPECLLCDHLLSSICIDISTIGKRTSGALDM
jgi:hypothetical protein